MHKEFDGAVSDPCPDDPPEVWRPVLGYEGLYSVSSHGRVRGEERIVRHYMGGPKRLKQRVMRQKLCRGYPQVQISQDGAQRFFYVHRLVAEAFLEPVPGADTINHKNGVKADNRVSNLEMLSIADNVRHSVRTGLRVSPAGEDHYRAILTNDEVLDMRRRAPDTKYVDLAAEYGISVSLATSIITGKRWSRLPGALAPIDMRGETNRMSKLTNTAVLDIRARAGTTTRKALAAEYGVSSSLISFVVNGKTWRHLLPTENDAAATK